MKFLEESLNELLEHFWGNLRKLDALTLWRMRRIVNREEFVKSWNYSWRYYMRNPWIDLWKQNYGLLKEILKKNKKSARESKKKSQASLEQFSEESLKLVWLLNELFIYFPENFSTIYIENFHRNTSNDSYGFFFSG